MKWLKSKSCSVEGCVVAKRELDRIHLRRSDNAWVALFSASLWPSVRSTLMFGGLEPDEDGTVRILCGVDRGISWEIRASYEDARALREGLLRGDFDALEAS